MRDVREIEPNACQVLFSRGCNEQRVANNLFFDSPGGNKYFYASQKLSVFRIGP